MSIFQREKHTVAETLTALLAFEPSYDAQLAFLEVRARAEAHAREAKPGEPFRALPRDAHVGLAAVALVVEAWEGPDAAALPWPELNSPADLDTRCRTVARLPASLVPGLVGVCVRRLILPADLRGN